MSGSGDFASERVLWTEGMLVSPQHLQQETRFHERLLAARLQALSPYGWGVLNLDIDTNALAADELRVNQLVAVFPDGTPLALHRDQLAAPPRTIGKAFPASQKTLHVFIGISREREGVANIAPDDGNTAKARYAIDAREVADLSSGRESRVLVSFGRLNPVILFNDEANEDYDSLKIAEVVRDASGKPVLAAEYVPACLQIGTSPYILSGLNHLFGLVTSRQRALAETCRERSASTLEFQSTDITAFLQLNALNAMLPVLQHMIDAPQISPWHAYLLLIQLAGQLSTFGVAADPAGLPKFTYTDLGSTYRLLFEYLTNLLSTSVIKRYVSLSLKLYPNGVMLAELEDPRLAGCETFVLTAKSEKGDVAPEKLAIDLPKLSKIGSKTTIKSIVQAAANGVPMHVAHRVPPEVPIRDGTVYFAVDVKDNAWKAVLNDRNIAVYMPPPYNPGKVRYELLAIPSEE